MKIYICELFGMFYFVPEVSTVEGLLDAIISGLEEQQPHRKVTLIVLLSEITVPRRGKGSFGRVNGPLAG